MCKDQFEKAGVFTRWVVCKGRFEKTDVCGMQESAEVSLRKLVYVGVRRNVQGPV
jgi:hypothetical protein